MSKENAIRVLGVQRELADVVGSCGNSAYKVGKDISILLDEVLNNDISAVFVYGDFDGGFSDVDLYSLSVVMRKNVSVLALTINGVDIGDETMSLLCDSLLHSNVQYLDLTNTPLDEEAGRSLAALAQNNHNIRTVIVEETLISEEAMDEIDMACQFNEIGFALPSVVIAPNKKRLCVSHQFNACPNGDFCIYAHTDNSTADAEVRDWSELLKTEQLETGASWKNADQSGAPTFTLNRDRIKRSTKSNEDTVPKRSSDKLPFVAMGFAVFAVAISWLVLRKK